MPNGMLTDNQQNPFYMDDVQPTQPVGGMFAIPELIRAPAQGVNEILKEVVPPVYVKPEAKETALDLATDTGRSLKAAVIDPVLNTEFGKDLALKMAEYAQSGVDFFETEEGQATAKVMEGSTFWVPWLRASGGARNFLQMFAQNLTNNMKKPDGSDFYKNPGDYVKRWEKEGTFNYVPDDLRGYVTKKASEVAAGISKLKATGQGIVTGIKNTAFQTLTPQGQADWRVNRTSKTLRDLVESDTPEYLVSGQMLYENLVGTQMDNLGPVLKKLDDEFFVHKSVLNVDDFKKFLGEDISPEDAAALWRTMLYNNKISRPGEFVMVGRTARGKGQTGQLDYLALHKGTVPKSLDSLFPLKKPYKSADDFISALDRNPNHRWDRAGVEVGEARKNTIKWAWETQGERLSQITDPKQLTEALAEVISQSPASVRRKAGGGTIDSKIFPVKDYVKRAVYTSDKGSFENNDQLYAALKEIFPGAQFVPSGSKLLDAVRKRIPYTSRGMENKTGVTVLRNTKQANDPAVYIMHSGAASDAYELGAVNILYKLTPDGKLTAMINDVNDIAIGTKDVNLPGARKAIVITNPVSRNIRTNSDKSKIAIDAKDERTVSQVSEQLRERPKAELQDYASAAEPGVYSKTMTGRASARPDRPPSPFDIK